jgi:large conductance mechanosensitive channel
VLLNGRARQLANVHLGGQNERVDRRLNPRYQKGESMDPVPHSPAFDPRKKAYSLWEEFKKFAFKGNVIDLAVAVVIGAAFTKIIDSLVKSIFMPLISLVMPSEHGYLGWKFVVSGKEVLFGQFIGEVVNFLVVALALFIFIVKFLGWVMRSRAEQAPAPPPTKDQELLMEIRDLLKQKTVSASPGH